MVLSSRNGDTLEEIVKEIRGKGGQAIHVVADVHKPDELQRVADMAVRTCGGFDSWVNDAGICVFGRLQEVPDADHRQLFEVNFWGVIDGTRIAAAHLRSKGGAIINLGSVASDVGFPIQGMYSASKHAIKGFTDSFRTEMEEEGAPVSITLIKPAAIDTPFAQHAANSTSDKPIFPPPVYLPEDVADAILQAAVHGDRDIYIGGGARLISALNNFVPAAIDWIDAHMLLKQSVADASAVRAPEGSLNEAGVDGSVRGDSPHHVQRSIYSRATTHPVLAGAVAAGVAVAGAALYGLRGRG